MMRWILPWSLVAALAACGDNSPSTTPIDAAVADAAPDAALAPITTASPVGGTWRALPTVTLTSDRAATIYYTTDGSTPTTASTSGASPVSITTLTAGGTLKFFAVPPTGPTEAVHTEVYVVDRLGPTAVDGFTATANGSDVDLAWTDPTAADFTDVVIARTTDVATTVPTDGSAVAVGDTVGAGTVVFIGAATSFTDANPGPGGATYVAWARYKNGAFAEGRTAAAYVEPAAQTGEIAIDLAGSAASVTTQPTAWTLSTSNYVATDATHVAFDLTATSTAHGMTFTPKLTSLVLTPATTANTATVTTDGVIGTDGVVLLGGAVAEGGSLTKTIHVTLGAADTAVTFAFGIRHDQARYYPDWTPIGSERNLVGDLVSTATAPGLPSGDRTGPTNANNNTQFRELVVSADGRWIFAGQRSSAHIVKIDTTTGLVVAGADLTLTGSRGSARVTLDPSGHRLYATFNDGMHIGADRVDATKLHAPAATANSAFFLEIDPATMTERSRLPLTTATDPQHVAREPVLSRDGRAAVFVIGGGYTTANTSEVAILDLSPMTLRDFDTTTAGQQNLNTAALRPNRCAFSFAADHVLCTSSTNNRTGDNVTFIDTAALTSAVVDADGVATTEACRFKIAVPRPDGKFWLLGDRCGLWAADPTGAGALTNVAPDNANSVIAAALSADGSTVVANDYRRMITYATATGAVTVVQTTPNGRSYIGHTLARSPF